MTTPGQTLPPPTGGLRRRAAGAVRWTVVSSVVVTALQFAQLAALGRLLSPEAFGLMALILIVLNFAQLFGQMGLGEALIQRKDSTREEISSLYWLNVVFSVVIFLVLWATSPLIAGVLGAPELEALLPVAALSFLLVPFGFQFRALAQKTLRFRLLAGVEITAAAIALAVAVPSAWLFDQGVWSLVWGYLSGTSVGTIILVVSGWWNGTTRPLFHFHRKDLAGYLGFGLYRTGAMSVNFFNLRVAQLFVGTLLGAQALGYYSVATNLVLQPAQKLNLVLARVAFPVLSLVQDDVARLRRGYLEMIYLLMFMSAPILIGAAVVAPTAVPFLMGEQWVEAVPLVQVLAFYALLRSLGGAGGSLLMACGRANWGFYWNVVLLLVIPPVVYLASRTGDVLYVALSLVVVQALLSLAFYCVFVRNLIGPCFVPYVRAAGVPVLLAGAMGAVVLATGAMLGDLPAALLLGAQVLIGVVSYTGLMWLFRRKDLRNIARMTLARS